MERHGIGNRDGEKNGDVSALLPRNPSPSILIPIVSGVLWNVLLRIGFMDRCLHLVSCKRRCDADKSTTLFMCFFSGFKTEFFSKKAIACHKIIILSRWFTSADAGHFKLFHSWLMELVDTRMYGTRGRNWTPGSGLVALFVFAGAGMLARWGSLTFMDNVGIGW